VRDLPHTSASEGSVRPALLRMGHVLAAGEGWLRWPSPFVPAMPLYQRLGSHYEDVLVLFPAMDPSFTYTVGDLASDAAVRLRCDCRVRTYGRAELAALVGRDARLHLIGLRRELWCRECGEPPFHGWIASRLDGH
jgi:hypothetical protein